LKLVNKAVHKTLHKEDIEVILCDAKLTDDNRVDRVKVIKPQYPSAKIILLTSSGKIGDGVQTMKQKDQTNSVLDNRGPTLPQAMGREPLSESFCNALLVRFSYSSS
jgi:hypothetical protein